MHQVSRLITGGTSISIETPVGWTAAGEPRRQAAPTLDHQDTWHDEIVEDEEEMACHEQTRPWWKR